ncbi:class I SAM-dependent methyltransferase [uncultured Roseivirga sp.]|uniref:class I SAM-dependent methyltransferase n=1 Tax=uncultured Roseivirga sp. TaxID=543088 RepID=UPI0030D726AA
MRSLLFILPIIFLWSCSSKPKEEGVDTSITPQEEQAPEAPNESEKSPELQEDAGRTEWQNPEFVLNLLGDLTDKTVADVGAGSGYFTFKIARKAKKVIALDIDPNSLEYIQNQKSIVGSWADNIDTRLTPADVPNLLDNEVDIVLIVNTYAYIPNKSQYLSRLKKGMKHGGLLVIIDFKTGEIPVGPSDEAKVSSETLEQSLKQAGFSNTKTDNKSLQYQYIITAKN